MKPWQKFILLILISAVVHELGHVIVGGGVVDFKYAPDLDPLSFRIQIPNWNYYSILAGFVFTLPLLLFRVYPQYLFLLFLFQSRWDFLTIYVDIANISFMDGWQVN